MRSSPLEALLVLELHRAMFKFNHAKTDEEREVYHKQAETAQKNLAEFVKETNDRQVQGVEKADTVRKAIPTMCIMRKANYESK